MIELLENCNDAITPSSAGMNADADMTSDIHQDLGKFEAPMSYLSLKIVFSTDTWLCDSETIEGDW